MHRVISKQSVCFKSLIPMIIKTPVVSHEIWVQLQKLAMDSAGRWFAGVFFKSFLSWLYWWWFHYLSLSCLYPTLGLGLQAEGLGLHCLLEASVVACEEPIYYLRYLKLTIFRTLVEPFLQIFVEKAWSPTSLVQGRKHPLWGTWICSQGPARHRKILLPKPARSQAQQWVWASRLPNQLQSKVHPPHQQDQTEERGAASISLL